MLATQRLRQRADDLAELARAMGVLEDEIGWRRAGLLAIAGAHTELGVFRRWADFARRGTPTPEALLLAAGEMTLRPQDEEVLRQFAESAGRLDTAGQLDRVRAARRQLEERAAQARREAGEKSRVQLALALCAGGVVSLLLL